MKVLLVVSLIVAAGCAAPAGSSEESTQIDAMATSFENGERTISVGETVTFVMVEQSHTVDFAEGDASVEGVSVSHSGNLNEGEAFTVTFNAKGTYAYFCKYHSSLSGGERVGMIGTITVV